MYNVSCTLCAFAPKKNGFCCNHIDVADFDAGKSPKACAQSNYGWQTLQQLTKLNICRGVPVGEGSLEGVGGCIAREQGLGVERGQGGDILPVRRAQHI